MEAFDQQATSMVLTSTSTMPSSKKAASPSGRQQHRHHGATLVLALAPSALQLDNRHVHMRDILAWKCRVDNFPISFCGFVAQKPLGEYLSIIHNSQPNQAHEISFLDQDHTFVCVCNESILTDIISYRKKNNKYFGHALCMRIQFRWAYALIPSLVN